MPSGMATDVCPPAEKTGKDAVLPWEKKVLPVEDMLSEWLEL